MNKLISLSSEGKFSIIDSVVDKVSVSQVCSKKAKTEQQGKSSSLSSSDGDKTSSYEVISTLKQNAGSTTQQFEIIEEEEDEDLNEDEALEEIKRAEENYEQNNGPINQGEEKKDEKQIIKLEIKDLDMNLTLSK